MDHPSQYISKNKRVAPGKRRQPKAPRQDSIATKTPEQERQVFEEAMSKQERFADRILQGHSAHDAARAAGYHPSQASKVMRQEDIQALIAKGRNELSSVTTIRRLDVMNMFLEAIDMARTLADPGQMINGADKIAKMMGYYAPETKRIELTGDQKVFSSKLRALTDAELYEIAHGNATASDIIELEPSEVRTLED